jgi:hypothetical protein
LGFDNQEIIKLKARKIIFELGEYKFIAPLDPSEGRICTELVTKKIITDEVNQFYRANVTTLTQLQMECRARGALVHVHQTLRQAWRIGNNIFMSYLPKDVQE